MCAITVVKYIPRESALTVSDRDRVARLDEEKPVGRQVSKRRERRKGGEVEDENARTALWGGLGE